MEGGRALVGNDAAAAQCRLPPVSIVTALHNGGQFVAGLVRTVLRQDYAGPLEWSVYDDGSTDGSAEAIRQCYESQPSTSRDRLSALKIRGPDYADSPPAGVAYAKNRAVLQSNGLYLCFLDADDTMSADRVSVQLAAVTRSGREAPVTLCGGRFDRTPAGSTHRYTRWANDTLRDDNLHVQIYTSHGPTLIAPTWFCHRNVWARLGGFDESHNAVGGFPEDLHLFYRHLRKGGRLHRVDSTIVTYAYHERCASFGVSEATIWRLRLDELLHNVLCTWQHFYIGNAGKQGRRLYKGLPADLKQRVVMMCDVDNKKLHTGVYEQYCERSRRVLNTVPIGPYSKSSVPIVICVKLDMTNGDLEAMVERFQWRERVDFVHFG